MPKPTILASTRKQLVEHTNQIFKSVLMLHPDVQKVPESKACLFWAQASILAGRKLGGIWSNLQLQGGSASWRIIKEKDDDGVQATHYSYQWDGVSPLLVPDETGDTIGLAEVHFWAAIAPNKEMPYGIIVDTTTRFIPELLRETELVATCYPPNSIICYADELTDCRYEASLSAVVEGTQLIDKLFRVSKGRFVSFKQLKGAK